MQTSHECPLGSEHCFSGDFGTDAPSRAAPSKACTQRPPHPPYSTAQPLLWGRPGQQTATSQGNYGLTARLLRRAQPPLDYLVAEAKAGVSPAQQTSPFLHQLSPRPTQDTSPQLLEVGLCPHHTERSPNFLFLPEAQEPYCPPADQGSP